MGKIKILAEIDSRFDQKHDKDVPKTVFKTGDQFKMVIFEPIRQPPTTIHYIIKKPPSIIL